MVKEGVRARIQLCVNVGASGVHGRACAVTWWLWTPHDLASMRAPQHLFDEVPKAQSMAMKHSMGAIAQLVYEREQC